MLCGEAGFIDDEATIGSGSNISILSMYTTVKDSQMYYYYYIKYKNQDAYRLGLDPYSYNVGDVVFVYHPQGLEGKTREYKGEQWTVLYDKGDTLELVSPKTIGTVVLGEEGNIEKSIADYNNAVSILNKYCRDNLNDQTARSVGCNSNNPDSDNPGMYTSDNLASWLEGSYNGVGKNGDENAEQDFVRMAYYGISVAKDITGNNAEYWLASRVVYATASGVGFLLEYAGSDSATSACDDLWNVSSGSVSADIHTSGVRAIVTVDK